MYTIEFLKDKGDNRLRRFIAEKTVKLQDEIIIEDTEKTRVITILDTCSEDFFKLSIEKILISQDISFDSRLENGEGKDTLCRKYRSKDKDETYKTHSYYDTQYIEMNTLKFWMEVAKSTENPMEYLEETMKKQTIQETFEKLEDII